MKKIYITLNDCFEISNEGGEIELVFNDEFDFSMFKQILKYEFGNDDKICDNDGKKYFFNKVYFYNLKGKMDVYLFGKKIKFNNYLTSNEVAELLGISLQNLSYLRNKKLIPFYKVSDRNIIYPIEKIMDFMVKYKKIHIRNKNKLMKNKNLSFNDENKIEKSSIAEIDVLDKYLFKKFVLRIPETRFEKGDKFILNFSYIFEGSGLILINDEGLVEDVYEHTIFTNSVNETIELIEKSKIQPFVEETGIDYKGFTKYYLNNIYKRLKKNNFAFVKK
jgi:predicted transcriptional regulator